MTLKQIRTRYTRVIKIGKGWSTYLEIDHQGFQINGDCEPTTRKRARWYADMLAFALKRFLEKNDKASEVAGRKH